MAKFPGSAPMVALVLPAWLLGGCAGPTPACPWQDTAREQFAASSCAGEACLGDWIQVVPSRRLPAGVRTQNANNNLDVVSHGCRVFLAFRTAPNHFASPETVLYVMSSADQATWRFEGKFGMGTDLREPRFLSWQGRLFLYFAVLGDDMLDFNPRGMMVTEYLGPEGWTEPAWFYETGHIPWRTKVVGGTPYLLSYVGGENIYDLQGGLEVHWLTTENGTDWAPVVAGQPVVLRGGGSETDFVFLHDGTLIAVSRNEAGDEDTGWGTKICRAEADDPGAWSCIGDPKKYDSPLLFTHADEVLLIGRRNVTETGHYDLGYDDLSFEEQTRAYEVEYWNQPKRCSLWKIDPRSLSVSFELDLPSRGDTCFPGLLRAGPGLFEIYNYTSPLDGEDISWLDGQLGPTWIVRQGLRIGDGDQM